MIELNTTPSRMELDWRWWKQAREQGVMCSVNPDAHSTGELGQVALGLGAARKGWLRAGDIHTRPLTEVAALLARKRKG